MTLEKDSLAVLQEGLKVLEKSFDGLPDFMPGFDLESLDAVLRDVATRMQDNFPYPHPLYAGQMLKPPHPIARLAYMLSLWINPNNHALDGGRASSQMEKEAVAEIAGMFGWEDFLGHLCGGGTMANMEALWIAGQLHPGKTVVASTSAHYTHGRISKVLGLPFAGIGTDTRARMDLDQLKSQLDGGEGSGEDGGEVGTVVVTLGTTGVGSTDPLPEILALRDQYGFRVHIDAAYGGYFRLVTDLEPDTAARYALMQEADSIVIDPHKHGLQPYGCGCVLFKDTAIGRFYDHSSPYTYFSSDELHLGEISLECSRAGASAVALWATQRLLPLTQDGAFAADLKKCVEAASQLYRFLADSEHYLTLMPPELDIVVWAPKGASLSDISRRSKTCFDRAASAGLHLALFEIPAETAAAYWGDDVVYDAPSLTCLRSTLMKPEHLDWLERITVILEAITQD